MSARTFALLVALLAPGIAAAQSASQRLDQLADDAYERALDLFPFSETFGRGAGPRQDKLEITFSDEHRERQRAYHRWILAELDQIPPGELDRSEKLTHALLAWRSRDSLEWLARPWHYHYLFIQLNGGVAYNLVQLIDRQPFRNAADYQAWFRRVHRYPALLEATAATMREGAAAGITTPRVLVERALPQLEALAPEEMEKSALWRPMTRFPASMSAAERAAAEAEYRKLLAEEMFPAIRKLATFVRNDYLPHARTTDGFGALPGGAEMYRYAVRSETTTELTPEAVYALGLSEVKRIQPLFLAAGARAGFKGEIKDVYAWLQTSAANYPFHSPEEVIAYLNAINARIVPQLPRLFSRLPKARFEIRPTDPAIAASTPAQYYAPSDDGTRPGVFAMPIVDPRRVSTFGLAALLAHEGMPGHHFDISRKLEMKASEFRRHTYYNAYGEGWGLYAESLGQEMGLYDAPLELMGRYSYELWRACRLVVDTGLHAKGWTREQAIRYMAGECAQTEGNSTLEVLRYMAWPGQALGYKIGELTLLELRAKARKQLGARFDLRAFHEVVLGEGHLPLSLLRQQVDAWIATQDAK